MGWGRGRGRACEGHENMAWAGALKRQKGHHLQVLSFIGYTVEVLDVQWVDLRELAVQFSEALRGIDKLE